MSNFDPNAIGYSALNASWLSQCAGLAYQPHNAVKEIAEEWEFIQCHFFDISDSQGFLIASDDLIVLAFRGTEPSCLRDWMTDARLLQVKGCGKGLVHRGFLAGLDCIWRDLATKLVEFRTQEQPLLITGHSLGAALATLAAARFQEKGQTVNGLYTFGSPRVGNEEFAKWFDAAFKHKAFRFINNNDVVTRVPPRSLGYRHVGRCLYFDVAGTLQDDPIFWNKFLETVKGGIDDFLKPGVDNIKDHDMGTYAQNVLKNINKVLSVAK